MLTPKRCNLVKCGILCARGRDVPFPVERAAERMTATRCPVPRRKSKTLRGGSRQAGMPSENRRRLFFPHFFFPFFPPPCLQALLRSFPHNRVSGRTPGLRLVDLLVRCQRAGGPKSVPCAALSWSRAWNGCNGGEQRVRLGHRSATNDEYYKHAFIGDQMQGNDCLRAEKTNHACFLMPPRHPPWPPHTHPPIQPRLNSIALTGWSPV